MIDSMSGFLAPEQRVARVRRRASSEPDASTDASLVILKTLTANDGPLPVSDLLGKVHASSRSVVSALDDLEASGYVRLVDDARTEIVTLTDAGRRAADA